MNNSTSKLNYKFILLALKGEWPEAFQLLARGANVNTQDDKVDFTAVHYAVLKDNIDAVRQLAVNKADLNLSDYRQLPPMAFCMSGEMLELLVELGANPSIGFEHGSAPFQCFYKTGDYELAAAYIDLGLPVMPQFTLPKLSIMLHEGCYPWFRLLTGIEVSVDDLEIIQARPQISSNKAERKQQYVADKLVKAIYDKPFAWCRGNKTYEEFIRQP